MFPTDWITTKHCFPNETLYMCTHNIQYIHCLLPTVLLYIHVHTFSQCIILLTSLGHTNVLIHTAKPIVKITLVVVINIMSWYLQFATTTKHYPWTNKGTSTKAVRPCKLDFRRTEMGGVLRDVHYLEYTRFDVPSTHSYNVDERGLSRVLQTYERQLHLFLPE